MTEKNTKQDRPAVVAVMGHIDHGKSTLLDYIRNTNIVDKEAGGITQHISAYKVTHKNSDSKDPKPSVGQGKDITFLDTPGHEAFSAMRSRGAHIADIAILIVSAEEGVKPQTLEALDSIKKAGIPFVIAINKIDKPEANIERTKNSLLEKEIYLEGSGGDISYVPVSAKTGEGVSELLDLVLLTAELEELKGDDSKDATGFVLESNLNPKKGVSATLIIKDGTLKKGSFVTINDSIAPVRIMEDFSGKSIDSASFSSPVRVIGFNKIPEAGAKFQSYNSRKEAEKVVSDYIENLEKQTSERFTEEEVGKTVIPLIIKADVWGTIEAIQHEMAKIKNERTLIKVVSAGVGEISENDIKIAGSKRGSIVIGFNAPINTKVQELAERLKVDVQNFDIIYKLTEWLEKTIIERTPKIKVEEVVAQVKILRIFSHTKDKQVIGGRVESGTLPIDASVKIIRRDFEIGSGKVTELQKAKMKVKEVNEGDECGMLVEAKNEIARGDILEAFVIVEK
jgi:translation initiation factor IF-2